MSEMPKPQVETLHSTRFMSLYDLVFKEGAHYYEASRHKREDLLVMKNEDQLMTALPDAVSACLVVEVPGDEPRMVLSYEYRYPIGQFVLGIPSGLIDAHDCEECDIDPRIASMTREIAEETGIQLKTDDRIWVVNPLLFCSPGLTDESTALLCAVAHLDDPSVLSHEGAEGGERFGDFVVLSQEEVLGLLEQGRDFQGNYYPMVAWMAMAYFAAGWWRNASIS